MSNGNIQRNDIPLTSEEPNSSSSEKIIISSNENSFTVKKIKSRKALSQTLKNLKNPFVILDKEFISDFNIKDCDLKEGESFKKQIDFSKIPKEKFLFLDNENKISDYYSSMKNNNNNVIFSSFNYTKKEENNSEKDLFTKLFKFSNDIKKECNIGDFCFVHKNIFENNSIEKFYSIIRKPRSYSFRYHLYYDRRIIMKYFGPRKTSKSIYMRCVLANYYYKYQQFRPTLIFDIAFINKNIVSNNSNFQKVFYYELFSLFNDKFDVDEFFKIIDFILLR